MTDGSITRWFGDLRAGDDAAVAAIYDRYFDRLVAYARGQLGSVPARVADEEDVALSALHCLAAKVADGRYVDLQDRTDLWKVLLTMTARKASDERKRQSAQKRGGKQVRGESVFENNNGDRQTDLREFARADPSSESIAALNEQVSFMLAALPDDSLRRVAELRIQGHSIEEIAEQLPSTKRTVIRKLNRVRENWLELVEGSDEE